MSAARPFRAIVVAALAGLLLMACSSKPPPPDWQMNARSAIEHAIAAHLDGNARVEAAELARARSEVGRTGRLDLLARIELMHCAARVASLAFEPCEGFDKLRGDAAEAERAYADYLAARTRPQDVALLPPPHRALAGTSGKADDGAALRAIEDPLSRLIAAGVLMRADRAGPQTVEIAIDTASGQGWRRPLLAWLHVQLKRAEQAQNKAAADQLRRRISVVQGKP
jgi:hypothetical protein